MKEEIMIYLRNGSIISNVVFSTCFGHSGSGMFPYILNPFYQLLLKTISRTATTVFAKSATRFKRVGNFIANNPLTWRAVRRLPNMGMLNAYGLTNPGVEVCAHKINRANNRDIMVIPNFFPEFSKGIEKVIKETLQAVGVYRTTLGVEFQVLELNFSCPNSGEDFTQFTDEACRLIKRLKADLPWLAIIAKISIRHPLEFSVELKRSGVDVIHAINTIPWAMVYPNTPSPIADLGGGGVSGNPAHPLAMEYCKQLRQRIDGPMIWGCVATEELDVIPILRGGAHTDNSVSLCTAGVRDPLESRRIVQKFNN